MSEELIEKPSGLPAEAVRNTVFEQSADDNLYDLFKHMTTLSLVSLGGIMTIVSEEIVAMKPLALAIVVGLIAIGGIGAFSGMMELSEAKSKGEDRSKRIALYRSTTSLGFGMGMGAFLSNFLLEVLL